MSGADSVIARRRAEQEALLDTAHWFARGLPEAIEIHAVVVVGSVARGDFNEASDIDVVVIADALPQKPLARLRALGALPARVEPVVWTPDEWRAQLARENPIATEAIELGQWVVGDPTRAGAVI